MADNTQNAKTAHIIKLTVSDEITGYPITNSDAVLVFDSLGGARILTDVLDPVIARTLYQLITSKPASGLDQRPDIGLWSKDDKDTLDNLNAAGPNTWRPITVNGIQEEDTSPKGKPINFKNSVSGVVAKASETNNVQNVEFELTWYDVSTGKYLSADDNNIEIQ